MVLSIEWHVMHKLEGHTEISLNEARIWFGGIAQYVRGPGFDLQLCKREVQIA